MLKIIVLLLTLCLGACGVDYEGTRVEGECQEDGASSGDVEGLCSDDGFKENCENDCDEPPLGVEYRFLVIEDTSVNISGLLPGVGLDSIALTKADGTIFHPTLVDDFNILPSDNIAVDPEAILGPSDDACQFDSTKIVSLGGPGGFLVVSFTTPELDVLIEDGDSITVFTWGVWNCPIHTYRGDDSYRLIVAASAVDMIDGQYLVIGSGGEEQTFPVNGLP